MRKTIFMAIMMFTVMSIAAQQPDRKQKLEEFRAKKVEFIRQKLNMTAAEEKAFWPVYNEFEQKKWQISQQRETLKQMAKKGNVDYAKLSDQFINNKLAEAQLAKEYHERFKHILLPEKLFKYYMAEREFKEKMLNDMRRAPEKGVQRR